MWIKDVFKNKDDNIYKPIEIIEKIYRNRKLNKKDKIHKNEVQDIRWSDEYKYRLAANITDNHIIAKLMLQRIIIPKFM